MKNNNERESVTRRPSTTCNCIILAVLLGCTGIACLDVTAPDGDDHAGSDESGEVEIELEHALGGPRSIEPLEHPSVPGPGPGHGEVDLDELILDSFDPYPSLEDHCVEERRVVKLGPDLDACPAATDWNHRSIFADYCIYQWSGAATTVDGEDIAVLEFALGGLTTEPDCIVRSQGQSSSEGLLDVLERNFEVGTGRLTREQLGALFGEDPGEHVLLAVIDSADRDPSARPGSHGAAMVDYGRSAAAGFAPGLDGGSYVPEAPSCRRWKDWDAWEGSTRRVESFTGLPHNLDVNLGAGDGAMGFRSDLAAAIHEAVECWLSATPADTKLVLNLSVGWEPGLGLDGGVGEAMIIDALLAARCRGAAVFAASGNRKPLACVTGPVGPAILGEQDIAERCAAAGLPEGTGTLLEPVTPVDVRGRPLGTEREWSGASIRALGCPAIGSLADDQGHRSAMSGSSTSTAVVSGIAALVWSYAPDLSSEELVALLYESGEALASETPAYIGMGAGQTPRVLTACSAVASVCERRGVPCEQSCAESSSTAFELGAAYRDLLAQLPITQGSDSSTAPTAGGTPSMYQTRTPGCASTVTSWEFVLTLEASPFDPDVAKLPRPGVYPQPRRWPCSLCLTLGIQGGAAGSGEAHLIVTDDDTLDPADIRWVDITVFNASGDLKLIRYTDLPLSKTEVYVQPGPLCEVDGEPAVSGYVAMTFDDGMEVETLGNPIPVDCD